jgi:hypothetical protein
MRVRKQQPFYGTTQKEAEAEATIFADSVGGTIFFSAPVVSLPIGENDWNDRTNGRWTLNIMRRRQILSPAVNSPDAPPEPARF